MNEVWTMDDDFVWNYQKDNYRIQISGRPAYCDRGHYMANADGPLHLDYADSFPRYFMDLAIAKAEMVEWLEWRIKCQTRMAARS